MTNNQIISKHLDETTAYSDLEVPVVISSGESLTPFFINAEKLCRDPDIKAFLKENGNKSQAIVEHAVKLMDVHPEFKQDIEIIAEKVKSLYPTEEHRAVAGGQRRDWIFSGPVAKMLDVPHISLYKPDEGGKVEVIWPDRSITDYTDQTLPFYSVQVVDLVTKASSIHSDQDGKATGWVPMQRDRKAEVYDVVAVVTRKQGGEERLADLVPPIHLHNCVAIDSEFLDTHSQQAEVTAAYVADEKEWTKKYLMENGISVLVPYFEDNSKKLPRIKKFLGFYGDWLKESGLMPALELIVYDKYRKTIDEIVGGK